MKQDFSTLIIIFLMTSLIALSIVGITREQHLEKENELLRNELNIKNGKQWQQNIQQNMEKDQPIYF